MRVKFVKVSNMYKVGDTADVSPNVAHGLLDSGIAIISKDMIPDDYKQAGDKNGKSTKLRPDNRR